MGRSVKLMTQNIMLRKTHLGQFFLQKISLPRRIFVRHPQLQTIVQTLHHSSSVMSDLVPKIPFLGLFSDAVVSDRDVGGCQAASCSGAGINLVSVEIKLKHQFRAVLFVSHEFIKTL